MLTEITGKKAKQMRNDLQRYTNRSMTDGGAAAAYVITFFK